MSDWSATLLGRLSRRFNIWRVIRVLGVRGFLTLASLGIFAVLAQTYGAGAVGDYAFYIAFVTLIGNLAGCGFPQMLMRRVSKLKNPTSQHLANLRAPYWVGSALSSALFLFVGFGIAKWLVRDQEPYFAYLFAFGPIVFVANALIAEEMRGLGKAEMSLFANSFSTILIPLIVVFVSKTINIDHIGPIIILSHLISGVLFSMIMVLARGGLSGSASRITRVLCAQSTFDLVAMAAQRFVSGGMSHFIVLLVGVYGTATLTAFVAVGARLAGLAATFTGVINASFAKKVGASSRDAVKSRQLFATTCVMSTIGVALLMLPVLLFPSQFLRIFAIESSLGGAAQALQVLALSRVVRAFAGISDLFLLVTGQAFKELIATMCGFAALLVGLNIYSLQTPMGAVLALSQAVIIHGLLSAAFVVHKYMK